MPKCELLCTFIEITLRQACSPVNLLHIFRTPFVKNTSGWLLLIFQAKYKVSGVPFFHNLHVLLLIVSKVQEFTV